MKKTKLKQILKEKGITQTYVANKIGMPIKNFNYVVNGRVSLKLDVAKKIADVLEITLEDFF